MQKEKNKTDDKWITGYDRNLFATWEINVIPNVSVTPKQKKRP